MAFLIKSISSFNLLSKDDSSRDDDFVDRLHHKLSSGTLVALAALVSFKQFGGKPMECMVPDTFTDAWEEFAEMFCFAKNTYFLPFAFLVPKEERERRDREISYYQWVPFFLLCEAACFQIPFLLWRLLATHSGIKVHEVVRQCKDPGNLKMATRGESLKTVRIHLENALRFHRRLERRNLLPHSLCRCLNLPYTSFYVAAVYLLIKVMYMVNVLGQFMLLNSFLNTGTNHNWIGWTTMGDIIRGKEWEESGYFPRVTLCDIQVRVMGNVQPYTMQCVLVINILNEKIFVFLWLWFQMLVVLTFLSFLYWTAIMIVPYFSHQFVKRHLELGDMPVQHGKDHRADVNRFINSYLHRDGIFVLRMVEIHAGIIFASDLTCALWKSYYGIENIRALKDPKRKKPTVPQFSPDPDECKKISRYFNRRRPEEYCPPPFNPDFIKKCLSR